MQPALRLRRRLCLVALLTVQAGVVACSDGGSGPEEESGLLQISAADLDGASPGALVPAGFDLSEASSFRVQMVAGTRTLVDSTFPTAGLVAHEFEVEPNTYAILVEAFQSEDVVIFTGGGQATVMADDTVAVSIDLDPALGNAEASIGGAASATVPTNGTAPVRVRVLNSRGQPVSGATVEVAVQPSTSGTVELDAGETDAAGVVTGTLQPPRREVDGSLRIRVDGYDVSAVGAPTFSVVSPVDAGRSTLSVFNGSFVPADGVSAAEIAIRIVDAAGTPQPGIPVELLSSRNDGGGPPIDVFQTTQTETDASGEFRATLSSTTSTSAAGNATVTAVADGKVLDATAVVSFRSQVSAANTRISVAPVTVLANGRDVANIVVEVRGNQGQALPNVLVELVTNELGNFNVQPRTGRTDASGIFRSRISSTTPVSTFVDVVADGIRTSAVGIVIFN